MTKKDYIKFADMMIRLHRLTTSEIFGSGSIPMFQVSHELECLLEQDNPEFDRAKFNAYILKRVG